MNEICKTLVVLPTYRRQDEVRTAGTFHHSKSPSPAVEWDGATLGLTATCGLCQFIIFYRLLFLQWFGNNSLLEGSHVHLSFCFVCLLLLKA